MAAAAAPDYMGFLDNLFGDQSHMDYLNKLTAAGSPAAGLQLPSGFATATELGAGEQPAAAPTEYSGRTIDIEGIGKVPYEDFEKWRANEGLADPSAFKLDDYEAYVHGGSQNDAQDYQGQIAYRPKEGKTGFSTGLDQWVAPSEQPTAGWGFDAANYKPENGVMAYAGNLKDDNRMRVAYSYDNDGNLQGAHFAPLGGGLKNALKTMAPAVTMMVAPFLGPAAAAAGQAVGTAIPALGAFGSQVAGGALVGGGLAAVTGQNIGRGALMGGVGGAVSAANPASSLGINDKSLQGLVNSGISTAVKTGLSTTNSRR